MSLINWIFDIYQHNKVSRVEQDAMQLRAEMRTLRDARGGVDEERLLRAIGELALAVKTVQRACVQKGVCSEVEFQKLAREIDLEDGRADGMSPPPR